MHTAVIAAINILVIRNSRLGRPRIVIRCETPSRLCVRDGSRQESNNGRMPQEDDRGLGRNADGYDGFHVGSAAWPAAPHQQNALAGQGVRKARRRRASPCRGAQKARWAEFDFANEPSRPRGDFLAEITPPDATPPQQTGLMFTLCCYCSLHENSSARLPYRCVHGSRIELPTVRRASRSRCARAASASG